MDAALNRKILVARWTTELSSLRRRDRLTKEQEGRVLDLKMFLAAIDPLRKHEYDWKSFKDFDGKLLKEMKLQNSVNEADYRKNLKAKITYALAGTANPEPGVICKIDRAKIICEDHGESWPVMVEELLKDQYLRKEPAGFSISTLGCLVVERLHQNIAKPEEENPNHLFSRLNDTSKAKLASLKLSLDPVAPESRLFPQKPTIQKPIKYMSDEVAVKVAMRPTDHNLYYAKPSELKQITIKKIPAAKRVIQNDCASLIRKYEGMGINPATILNTLLAKRQIAPWQEQCELIQDDEELPAIWECIITTPQLPGKVFSSQGPNRRAARRGPMKDFLEELKVVHRVKPTIKIGK